MKIYLELKNPPNTIKELLLELFNYFNGVSTYYSVNTFYDKECKYKQCGAGRYRSIDDIIVIVRTYFPDESETNIFNEVFNLVIERNNSKYSPYLVDCRDIQKPTLSFYNDVSMHSYGKELDDSTYTWKYIWRLLGFNNGEEVKDHFRKLRGESV